MKKIERIGYGILVAIPVTVVAFIMSQASLPVYAQGEAAGDPECKDCHEVFYDAWEGSAHGLASIDSIFVAAWKAKGSPGQCLICHVTAYDPKTYTWESDGISCESCHHPVTATHPLEPMGMDYSSELCGNCHTETYFEWQVSSHRQEGLECIGCHDPHKTGLKVENAEELCASCHSSRADNFTHSAHSVNGLTCPDCHLGNTEQDPGDGHGKQDHSFYVNLSTCTNCHAYQLHDSTEEVHAVDPEADQLDAMASVEQLSILAEPKPASPIGFTTLAGMIGVALGIIIAPWLERWRHNVMSGKEGE